VAKPDIAENIDGIWIPDTARRVPGFLATVIKENARKQDISGLVGRLCLFQTWAGQAFDWRVTWQGEEYPRIFVYHLAASEIVGVCYEGRWVSLSGAHGGKTRPGEAGIRRCRTCKSKGEANMILDGDGVCPKCGCTPDGREHKDVTYALPDGTEVKTRKPVDVNENDEETFGTPRPKVVKGTAISYPGQEKRG
jgi:hypothetical protein